jgi:hypothetical protein
LSETCCEQSSGHHFFAEQFDLGPVGGSIRGGGEAVSNTESPYSAKRFSPARLGCKSFRRKMLCGVGFLPFFEDRFGRWLAERRVVGALRALSNTLSP